MSFPPISDCENLIQRLYEPHLGVRLSGGSPIPEVIFIRRAEQFYTAECQQRICRVREARFAFSCVAHLG